MVEVNLIYEFLPGMDQQAYMEWAKKAIRSSDEREHAAGCCDHPGSSNSAPVVICWARPRCEQLLCGRPWPTGPTLWRAPNGRRWNPSSAGRLQATSV